MNELHGCMIAEQYADPPPKWPTLFWRVFEAFEAGEFPLRTDTRNPVAELTDPEIAEIVRDL